MKNVSLILLRGVGIVFLLLGPFKFFGVFDDADYLRFENPLIPVISNRVFFAAVGMMETILGMYLVRSSNLSQMAFLSLWFVVAAVAYKFGLALVKYESPCNCLAGISKILPISRTMEVYITSSILVVAAVPAMLMGCEKLFGRRTNPRSPSGKTVSGIEQA